MRKALLFMILALLHPSCRTNTNSDLASSTQPDSVSAPAAPKIAPPFAEGQSEGIRWALRLNRGVCNHPPHPSTYCQEGDRERVAAESGIEQTLLSWIKDPLVESVRLSYFTFGSSRIAQALCDEAKNRSLKVDVYLQSEFVSPAEKAQGVYKKLLDCALTTPTLKVNGRGSKGWLNHAKIFLAQGKEFTRVTSSSANLSGSGISLHYDNWLFLETAPDDPIAQANRCFFQSLDAMVDSEGKQDKSRFQKNQQTCVKALQSEQLRFISVPSAFKEKRPLDLLVELIAASKTSITIAAHKITSPPSKTFNLVPSLVAAMARGVKVRVVFDDDTVLKANKLPGAETLNVSIDEINGYQALAKAGADIRFLDSNEKLMTLMHNKFMIIDGQTVFTGAGNFSSASLTGKNTEQFYIIKIPEIIAAYQKGWDELYGWSFDEAHYGTGAVETEAGQPEITPAPEEPTEE